MTCAKKLGFCLASSTYWDMSSAPIFIYLFFFSVFINEGELRCTQYLHVVSLELTGRIRIKWHNK